MGPQALAGRAVDADEAVEEALAPLLIEPMVKLEQPVGMPVEGALQQMGGE